MKPIVVNLIRIIREAPDDRSGLEMTMSYFVSLLRIRNEKLPFVEIMTIFRRHRPLLYRILTKNVSERNPVHFILGFEGDYYTSLRLLELTEEMIRTYPLDEN
jgi:hypothetical protein